jgi:chromosome partitioning protein
LRIVTIGNTKGGVGKSTIAANLAVAAVSEGKRTLLVDADEQGSTLDFRSIREADNIKAVSITTPTLHKDIAAFSDSYDLVIIDVGGKNSKTFRSAIVATGAGGLYLVPCLPSTYDIWSTEQAMMLLQEVRSICPGEVNGRLLVNQMQSGTIMAREAEDALVAMAEEFECPVLSTRLHLRAAYKTAIMSGKGVQEYDPRCKAAHEVKALYQEISNIIFPDQVESRGGK